MDNQSSFSPININNRYVLQNRLGAGGMGAVFRAFDRLQQHEVALKRVFFGENADDSKPSDATMNIRLVLANEFQVLASLHHPNIIRVLDYGFDTEKQPYFTMSLLETAQPITDYAQGKSLKEKIDLLIEMLQALAYMHRRNIIHRDLKPDNALVDSEGEVQVLDFGLATPQGNHEANEIAGTVAYMAPEVLQGVPVSKASDLYAVGVMAYEMIAGQHPFNTKNPGLLIQEIFFETPDISILDVPDGVANVIARLMLKEAELRYDDAYKVIEDLSRAMGQPVPTETAAIRESYLQAAEFVGREAEMAQLQTALLEALDRNGSVWIIGGESGVGKSRLLNEIRTQAMVRGALVLHGQGVAEGGITYEMWRDPLRRLILSAQLDEMDASILKQIIPDIGILLGRTVHDAPELDGNAGQKRLMDVVGRVIRSQQQPVVLLMEDLQWAEESLDMLRHVSNMTAELPLLIIGNYRDDEAPDLPKRLESAKTIKLERFNEKGIEQLSAAMLGTVGNRREVVDLLQRETEGNVFFLVEVVRALAEDAGSLQRIGLMTLPANIFAGGVQQVVQRRLDHVPFEGRNLLRIAAISGRYLDLNVLRAIEPETDIDNWLVLCSNVAVLEAADERWRFAHDKLREGLVNELSDVQKKNLHILVAEKLQEVYRDNVSEYAPIISDHYDIAQDFTLALYWHTRAAKHAASAYSPVLAVNHYRRALTLFGIVSNPIEDEHSVGRLETLFGLSRQLNFQGNTEESLAFIKQLQDEADAAQDIQHRIESRRFAGYIEFSRGNNEEALELLSQAETVARQEQRKKSLADILWLKGWCVARGGDLQGALALGTEVLELCELIKTGKWAEDAKRIKGQASNLVALVYVYTGQYDKAMQNYDQALEVQEQFGDKDNAMATTNNIGWLAVARGDYDLAIKHYDEAIKMAKAAERRIPELIYRGNRGGALVLLKQYEDAVDDLKALLEPAHAVRLSELSEIYRFLAEAYLGLGKTQDALDAAHQALELGLSMKNPEYVGAAWRVLANVAASVDAEIEVELNGEAKIIEPDASFSESERILKEANILSEHARTLRDWALYESAQNKESAQGKWQQAREIYEKMGANKELERMPEKLPVLKRT